MKKRLNVRNEKIFHPTRSKFVPIFQSPNGKMSLSFVTYDVRGLPFLPLAVPDSIAVKQAPKAKVSCYCS